jgi:uncharacterized repeat protein (TIGR01451 family)
MNWKQLVFVSLAGVVLFCLEPLANAAAADADVSISNQSSPATVELDALIHYTLTISNLGPAAANNVFVSDLFPIGMFPNNIVVSPANSGACVFNGTTSTIECDFGTLSAGESRTVDIDARAPFTGTITNVAQVTSNATDPDTNNNVAFATNLVVVLPADVALFTSANTVFAQTNQPVTFTVLASNAGPGKAFSMQIQERLPIGFITTNVAAGAGSYSTNNNVWTIPTLASNSSAALLLTGYRASAGTFTNTAYIAAMSNADPNHNNNTNIISVTWLAGPAADLQLSGRGPANALRLTDPALVTLTISNRGPDTSSNVAVQVLSWIGFQFSNAVAAPNPAGFDTNARRWTVGTIAPGASYDLQLTLRATNLGVSTVIAEVFSSALPDPDSAPNNAIANEDDQTSVNVTAAPTFKISGVIQDSAGVTVPIANLPFDVQGTNLAGTETQQVNAFSTWTVTNFLSGTYTVTPHKAGYIFTPTNQSVSIVSGDVSGVNFVVETLPRIEAQADGPNVLLSWPASATNFYLQGAPAVIGTWTNVTTAPTTNGTALQLELPAISHGVFRLIKP